MVSALATAVATEKAATATAAMATAATKGAGAMVAATKAALDPVMAVAMVAAAAMAVGAEWMKTMIFLRQLAPGGALAGSWGALRALKIALRPDAARS